MLRPIIALILGTVLLAAPHASAQMTYRVRGTVRDNDGKPVPNAKVRVEALTGFRGEQFVGQKEFDTTTGARGEWVILGLTSGIWAFEVTAPDVIPQVVLLPINFTNRKPQSAQGGSFPWGLPLWVRRSTNGGLVQAAAATTHGCATLGLASTALLQQSRRGVEDVVGSHRSRSARPAGSSGRRRQRLATDLGHQVSPAFASD